jgi:hypothetical protein
LILLFPSLSGAAKSSFINHDNLWYFIHWKYFSSRIYYWIY